MKTLILSVLMSVFWSSLGASALAQELTYERFVRADLEAREMTLAGMQTRLALLQQGADASTQAQREDASRENVTAVFTRYNTTGPAHAAYGTQHEEAILAWLEASPEWQQQYDALAARFDALSQQLDALRGGR